MALSSWTLVISLTSHLNWLKACQLTVQAVLGVALLWWIVNGIDLDGSRFIQIFSKASFLLVSMAIACFALSIVLKLFQFLMILPGVVPRQYMIGVILSQNALLTLLPWRIGDLSFPMLLRQDQNIPIVNSVFSLLTIRCLDLLIVMVVALIGIRKLGFQINLANVILGIGPTLAILFAFELTLRRLRRQTLLKIFVAVIEPLRNPMHMGTMVLLSIGVFSLTTLQSTFILHGLGLAVSLSDIALLNAFTLLVALLPIHPPGGWGTIDSIQIAILHYLNYQPEQSAPVILAAHCFYTVLVFSGGLFGWILRGRSLRH